MSTPLLLGAFLPRVAAWPWSKAGIASAHIDSDVRALMGSSISWAYNWNSHPGDWSGFGDANVQYVPMIWGHQPIKTDVADTDLLLGFNEPNDPHQSNLDPNTAASLWPQVEAVANAHGIQTLVGPAVNYASGTFHDPTVWYDQFLSACSGCRIDAIAIHIYNCDLGSMKHRIDMFRKYGKQIWVTEFACGDNPSANPGCTDKSANCQCAYMKQVIPYLEAEPLVSGYAWFSLGAPGHGDGYVGESALIANGQLTELGHCYSDLAGGSAPGPSPSPGPGPGPSTWYKTITPSENTNLCLDLPGDDSSDGNMLWLWECNGGESQRWVFDNYQIRFGADESKCIDASDMAPGTQLFLWSCNGLPQQTWGYDSDAARVYIEGTGVCFDYYEGWTASGQPLHVWDCNGEANQQWSLWNVGSQASGIASV